MEDSGADSDRRIIGADSTGSTSGAAPAVAPPSKSPLPADGTDVAVAGKVSSPANAMEAVEVGDGGEGEGEEEKTEVAAGPEAPASSSGNALGGVGWGRVGVGMGKRESEVGRGLKGW